MSGRCTDVVLCATNTRSPTRSRSSIFRLLAIILGAFDLSRRAAFDALRRARVACVVAHACTSLPVGAVSMEDTMACENRLCLNVA